MRLEFDAPANVRQGDVVFHETKRLFQCVPHTRRSSPLRANVALIT